jgi:hypothetical protein
MRRASFKKAHATEMAVSMDRGCILARLQGVKEAVTQG